MVAALLLPLPLAAEDAAPDVAGTAEALERILSASLVEPKVRLADKGTKVRELIGRFPLDRADGLDASLLDFLARHRRAFGLNDPHAELITVRTEKQDRVDRVTFQQTTEGYPIWGATIEMESDSGVLTLVVNRTLTAVPSGRRPAIKRREAVDAASREWKRQRDAEMPPCASELIVYKGRLVYDVKVPDEGKVYHIMVGASDSKIAGIEKVARDKSGSCH